jgi:hypothetical protein
MRISADTTTRRMRLFATVGFSLVAVLVGSALAADRPAASFYTPQQLKAMSSSWAAKGRLLRSSDYAASLYTPQQLKAMSSSWAAKGRVLSPDAASFYTRDQLRAMSSNWAAKGRLLGNTDWAAIGRLLREPSPAPGGNSGKLDWGNFGKGAGAMLGAVLLVAGLGAAIHYGRRRGGVRARPV